MSESDVEFSPPVRRIVKRKNLGVVETKKSSKALKAASLALAALGTIGAGRAIATDIGNTIEGGDSADNGVSVTIVPHQSFVEAETMQHNSNEFFDTIFHDLSPEQKEQTRQEVDEQKAITSSNTNFEEVKRNISPELMKVIEDTALAYGVSKDILIGIIIVESRGDLHAYNKNTQAAGIVQIMPKTGRQYGLIINENINQSFDPVLSIDVAGQILRTNLTFFNGDEGLAIWAYHAGEGNVFEAIRYYVLDVNGVDIGSYGDAIGANDRAKREKVESDARKYLNEDKIDIYKLLSNNLVKEKVLSKLSDETDKYTKKVTAADELWHENQDTVHDIPGGLKVAISKPPTVYSHK